MADHEFSFSVQNATVGLQFGACLSAIFVLLIGAIVAWIQDSQGMTVTLVGLAVCATFGSAWVASLLMSAPACAPSHAKLLPQP